MYGLYINSLKYLQPSNYSACISCIRLTGSLCLYSIYALYVCIKLIIELNTTQSQESLSSPLSLLYVHIQTRLAASATNPQCGHVLTYIEQW